MKTVKRIHMLILGIKRSNAFCFQHKSFLGSVKTKLPSVSLWQNKRASVNIASIE